MNENADILRADIARYRDQLGRLKAARVASEKRHEKRLLDQLIRRCEERVAVREKRLGGHDTG